MIFELVLKLVIFFWIISQRKILRSTPLYYILSWKTIKEILTEYNIQYSRRWCVTTLANISVRLLSWLMMLAVAAISPSAVECIRRSVPSRCELIERRRLRRTARVRNRLPIVVELDTCLSIMYVCACNNVKHRPDWLLYKSIQTNKVDF